ncbi:hypothetical protein [Mesorhizobium sp.]|uniref:hypothetical protein n=1 Tax=Mesorhizobium sp. TaxID=1871066 RepID=UPI000FE9F328|nr:hypothetical protein [Mesorhizobium sp.]RWK60128.1 MAG: hypothetical protein EOR49_22425 [Mesorhizobium sp.]RWM49414.1 MAG: hypothetical protein EOR78_27550 [Mesorhizobium sp.]RWM53740.1 MAG: hypothetical protein EOR76_00540 [Mesorhizobium sp.]RWM53994.1 MAG: hypothetical protein EOR79_24825 [Mesorhizobium sp.]RWM93873.1 MAG: hypothetical protein EOR85_26370 [Mesorhizobium sp.]
MTVGRVKTHSTNASATLIRNPFCTGIVYHRINRLWSEPGEIVVQTVLAIVVKNHRFSIFGAAMFVLVQFRRQTPMAGTGNGWLTGLRRAH